MCCGDNKFHQSYDIWHYSTYKVVNGKPKTAPNHFKSTKDGFCSNYRIDTVTRGVGDDPESCAAALAG